MVGADGARFAVREQLPGDGESRVSGHTTYHNDFRGAVAGKPVNREKVRRGFDLVHPQARRDFERGEDWEPWAPCDRDPVFRWVDRRIAGA